MEVVNVSLPARSYPIYIGRGLLNRAELLLPHLPTSRVAIVTDETVASYYLGAFVEALASQHVDITRIVIPSGEGHKDWQTLNLIFDALLAAHCERNTTLVALGGGVVGDIAGFAAATYLRGISFIQVPTTLLAQVDSAVGGKTAINHPRGKNMIGAFYQPRAVIADTDTLRTLPRRDIAAGIAEIIKYGLIRDHAFFAWLEQNMDALTTCVPEALTYAIRHSCECKASVVTADEREENGQRALLNFGHTFGHAIEAGLGYGTWLHGEAVAAGMVVAARISQQLGLLGVSEVERITTLLTRAGLPIVAPAFDLERYLRLIDVDKKRDAGQIHFVLLRDIGTAFVTAEVALSAIAAALAESIHA